MLNKNIHIEYARTGMDKNGLNVENEKTEVEIMTPFLPYSTILSPNYNSRIENAAD